VAAIVKRLGELFGGISGCQRIDYAGAEICIAVKI